MNILVTNDDGIQSKGIYELATALAAIAQVTVLAPHKERSTVSHSLTLHKPLRIKERQDIFPHNIKSYELSGMPADCVKVGLRDVLKERPDIVVSGINDGPNLGTDVVYSGTVSAAREAVLEGVPGIAVSLAAKGTKTNFKYAAEFIHKYLLLLQDQYWHKEMLFNINIPLRERDFNVAEAEFTILGKRKYKDLLEKRQDPAGREYYWLMGKVIDEHENEENSDVSCVLKGKVSITPLHYNYTHHEEIVELKDKIFRVKV